jgi:hypothetical protein
MIGWIQRKTGKISLIIIRLKSFLKEFASGDGLPAVLKTPIAAAPEVVSRKKKLRNDF